MNQQSNPAPFKVGQRLRFIRKDLSHNFFRNNKDESEGVVTIEFGTIGVVTAISDGRTRHRLDFGDGDGPQYVPPTYGWNIVSVDGHETLAVDTVSAGDWAAI